MDRRTWNFIIAGLVVAVLFAVGVSQFASGNPDGLEYVAGEEGFIETAGDHTFGDSPLADYGANLGGGDRMNLAVAGIAGVAITLAVGWGLFLLARRLGGRGQPHRSDG